MTFSTKNFFDLRRDQDDSQAIDQAIRAGVRVRGTNLWVLFFAILVASVGLNVNSTAVIIGAMLISPLMGPLVGIGYGAGINDYRLIRTSARCLLIFVVISLATSALYFLISPLSAAQSELLARTTPTLWDVLIAFFGGCAGIVALTRKDISNVIPGVAIATALMPPICTAGYGLATRNWEFFGGALYLFTINAFFIALATLFFVKLIRLPQYSEPDLAARRNTRIAIALGILVFVIPSGFLGYRLVRDQLFLSLANGFVKELQLKGSPLLIAKSVTPKDREISLTFWGEPLAMDFMRNTETMFANSGFPETKFAVSHLGSGRIDVAALRKELGRQDNQNIAAEANGKDQKIEELNLELAKLEAVRVQREQVMQEILAQYPGLKRLSISEGEVAVRHANSTEPVLVVTTEANARLRKSDYARLEAWLKVRFPHHELNLARDLNTRPTAKPATRQRKAKP